MDEIKYQELLDAANHAEHNGGRVAVDHDVLKELLAAWNGNRVALKLVQLASLADENEEELQDPEPFFPAIPPQERIEGSPSSIVSAEDLDRIAEEEKAKEDTSKPPEPTVQ